MAALFFEGVWWVKSLWPSLSGNDPVATFLYLQNGRIADADIEIN
jgi:hypothetical protein